MALANYTDLVNSINGAAAWLHRNDLAAIIPDWITLCEATINYGDLEVIGVDGLRTAAQETAWNGTTTAGTQTLALPSDFLEMRKLFITFNGIERELRQRPIVPMTQSERALVQGIPALYWIIGSTVYFDCIPDSAYAITGDYYAKIGPLASGTPTNWLLTQSPMVYLHGSIAHGAAWMGPRFDVTPWITGFKVALAGVARADVRKRGFGNVSMRTEAANIQRGRYNILTGY